MTTPPPFSPEHAREKTPDAIVKDRLSPVARLFPFAAMPPQSPPVMTGGSFVHIIDRGADGENCGTLEEQKEARVRGSYEASKKFNELRFPGMKFTT